MKHFVRLVAIAAITLLVADCSSLLTRIKTDYDVVTTATIPQGEVELAISLYDGAEVIAKGYQKLRRCNGVNGPICRDPKLRKQIDAWVYAGRSARNNLKAFMRTHDGPLGAGGDYAAIVAATKTLNDATAAYRAAINK